MKIVHGRGKLRRSASGPGLTVECTISPAVWATPSCTRLSNREETDVKAPLNRFSHLAFQAMSFLMAGSSPAAQGLAGLWQIQCCFSQVPVAISSPLWSTWLCTCFLLLPVSWRALLCLRAHSSLGHFLTVVPPPPAANTFHNVPRGRGLSPLLHQEPSTFAARTSPAYGLRYWQATILDRNTTGYMKEMVNKRNKTGTAVFHSL